MSFDVHGSQKQGMQTFARRPWAQGRTAKLVAASVFSAAALCVQAQTTSPATLPDAPSSQISRPHANLPAKQTSPGAERLPGQTTQALRPCPSSPKRSDVPIIFQPSTKPSCQDPIQLIVDTGWVSPLTVHQKGTLAVRVAVDPFNLLTIGFFSAISVAADAHSVYGPGFRGWGKEMGYSFVEEAQTDVTGTFVLPSLFREDPRYHRMPRAPLRRRFEHALIHTVISQHDDGSIMLNYATLINYPLSAEISNLYVPGIPVNAVSTTKRVLAGYATDPVGPLLAEFLPDFARRVHVHVFFAQQILNHFAIGSGEPSP